MIQKSVVHILRKSVMEIFVMIKIKLNSISFVFGFRVQANYINSTKIYSNVPHNCKNNGENLPMKTQFVKFTA